MLSQEPSTGCKPRSQPCTKRWAAPECCAAELFEVATVSPTMHGELLWTSMLVEFLILEPMAKPKELFLSCTHTCMMLVSSGLPATAPNMRTPCTLRLLTKSFETGAKRQVGAHAPLPLAFQESARIRQLALARLNPTGALAQPTFVAVTMLYLPLPRSTDA